MRIIQNGLFSPTNELQRKNNILFAVRFLFIYLFL